MSEVQAFQLSYDDGARAVELARESVLSYVRHGQREQPGSMRDSFYNRTGALVRIKSTRGMGRLRGCAGAYRSTEQLGHAIVDAAIEAASSSSCGSEIEVPELASLSISVCIILDYEPVGDPLESLQLGRHGVAIDAGQTQAWMYPTLPVEMGWSPEELLTHTARKAGLAPDGWADPNVEVTLFDGQVFRERLDGGAVEEVTV